MKSSLCLSINLLFRATIRLLILCVGFASLSVAADTITTSYTQDDSVFPNPERGFHNRYDLVPGGETDFSRSTNAGNTLVHSYVRLDAFRTKNISQPTLDQLNTTLGAVRSQGKKAILRIAYNFGPYPNAEPDASEYWIGQHLNQLSPVLNANKDVIAYLEAGFIGAWGEWHTSTNGLDTDLAAKVRIMNYMLQSVPDTIQIAMRYPSDIRSIINKGVSSSRLGNHQDCFLASDPDDWGTWGRDSAFSVAQDKSFIAQVGLDHPVGGETCNVSASRVSCANALAEMQQMHFSEINEDFDINTINIFKAQGCYNTIDQKLGYRFRLLDATYNNSVSASSTFSLKVKLINDGFASPFNRRPLFAVLDGAGGSYSFQLAADPRSWKPNQQVEINESFTLPASIPKGLYRLSLWLPDYAVNLRSDSRYSIRFANLNTWDSAKGYNVLSTNIQVGDASNSSSITYEAETAINLLGGAAVRASCASCSGQSKVGYLGNNSGTLQFASINAPTAGLYKLTIFYITAEQRTAQLAINNGAAINVSFASSGSWETIGSVDINVSLNAGTNTLKFSNSSGWAPDLDRITLVKVIEGSTPLVLHSFNDSLFTNNLNNLGHWTGANGFVNGGGSLSSGALVLPYQNNGWFGSDVSQDISNKNYLTFVIKGSAGGEENHFYVSLGGVSKSFSALTGDVITTSYKTIRINLTSQGISRTSPGQLQMTFWWGGSGQISIDEIRFE